MELAILGIIAAFNFMIIFAKFKRRRFEDGIFDTIVFGLIMIMFGGSYAGLAVGTVASLFMSIYFLASPPEFFSGANGFLDDFKRRARRSNDR